VVYDSFEALYSQWLARMIFALRLLRGRGGENSGNHCGCHNLKINYRGLDY